MHDYKADPNWLDTGLTALKLAVILTEGDEYRKVYPVIRAALDKLHPILYHGDKQSCKEVKRTLQQDVGRFLKGSALQVPIMRDIAGTELPYTTTANLLMSVARWPEFYMKSESEMKVIGQNMQNHLSEINAILPRSKERNRPCPYSADYLFDDHDWISTIRSQEPAVRQFLQNTEGYTGSHVTAQAIIEEMQSIANELAIPFHDPFEQGFFDSIQYIRRHGAEAIARFWRYIQGSGDKDMFSLSESKGPISEQEPVMQIVHQMGFKKNTCPMVLENLFHCDYPTIGIKPQQGQVEVAYNGETFYVAPGLGPGYKIRYVYNCHADIQNCLGVLADLIQEADRTYDRMESYNDQLSNLMADIPFITDAYCTDATGYSDFLGRHVYAYLMQLYGWTPSVIDLVLKMLAMPVQVAGVRYKVPYGSLQGVKMLVFIMNHANRLIGILARRLSGSGATSRSNAGDDVECHKVFGTFREEDIMAEIAVFAYFNCPTNPNKSAWLQRDGYFDFCSKYFALNKSGKGCFSITGLPPKIAGKQICLINNFAEMFKVLDISRVAHRSCLESWDIIFPYIKPDLEDGARLPAPIHKKKPLGEKIDIAKHIYYGMGGLMDWDLTDVQDLVMLARFRMHEILQRYTFDASGVFLLVNQMDESFQTTQLFLALGSLHRQGMAEVVRIMKILNEDNPDLDDITEVLGRLNRFERNIIRGTSISRNVSTYHRRSPDRDIDNMVSIQEYQNGAAKLDIPLPRDLVTSAMLFSALNGRDYTEIDGIRQYMEMQQLYNRHPGCITKYRGIGDNWYWALVEDGMRIRLSSFDSEYKRQEVHGFKNAEDIRDPELRRLRSLILQTGVLDVCTDLDSAIRSASSKLVKDLVRKEWRALSTHELDMAAKSVMKALSHR